MKSYLVSIGVMGVLSLGLLVYSPVMEAHGGGGGGHGGGGWGHGGGGWGHGGGGWGHGGGGWGYGGAAAAGFLVGAAAASSYNNGYYNNGYYNNYNYPAYPNRYYRCSYRCVSWNAYGQCFSTRRYCYYVNYYHGCDQWGRCW